MDPRITRLWNAQNVLVMLGVTYRKGGRVVLVTIRRDTNPLIGGWLVQSSDITGWVPTLRRAMVVARMFAAVRIADVSGGTR